MSQTDKKLDQKTKACAAPERPRDLKLKTIASISPESLGSIVFFNDSDDQAEHVGILTSIHNGSFYITHAVQGKYNRVIESVLQPGEYSIFTPTNIDLRLNILRNTRKAALEKIDYDLPRIELLMQIEDEMPFCHPATGLAAMYEFARISHEQNIWRRIKYFARKENGLVNNRGLRCSQLACILIQNSEACQNMVIDSSNANWVTDKHFLPHDKLEAPASPMERGFREYQARLREATSTGEYSQSHLGKKLPRKEINPMWKNSHQVWKPKDELAPEIFYRNSALPLDSKITSPKMMQYHMKCSPEHWGVEKIIVVPKSLMFNIKQKLMWKAFCNIQEKSQCGRSAQQGWRRKSPKSIEQVAPFQEAHTEELEHREVETSSLSPSMRLFNSIRLED